MRLRILLPFGPFDTIEGVSKLAVMTPAGSFGLLPHRCDCASTISPGLLSYSTTAGETHLAVDSGVMVKTGDEVSICVRHAIAGADLGGLRAAVEREFLNLSEEQKSVRTLLAQLESGFIRRLLELRHG
jgi:F-type H+-transporting ATPase subunit epsilon